MVSKPTSSLSLVKSYSNPRTGNIVFESGDELIYNLNVYNILGEKMYYTSVSNKQILDLSTLTSATYIVIIKQNTSIIKTERISIIH